MFKCVSVLVALVCLCNPSIGRSWGGSHDLAYDTKDYNDKSWLADPNDGLHRRSRQGWGQEYDSSEEEPWGKPDYQDYHRGNGSPPVASSSTPRSPAVTQSPPTSTTISSLVLQDIVRCIRDCPATPEFNPVCGTNNVTYNNLGALECNRNCGVNVALKRRAPCPQPLPPAYFISVATISTETPIRNAPGAADKNSGSIGRSASEQAPAPLPLANATPTRFTNIDANSEFNIARRANP